MNKREKKIKFETKYFKDSLYYGDFYLDSESNNELTIKSKSKKVPPWEYLWFFGLLVASIYFTYIASDFFLAAMFFSIFTISCLALLFIPKKEKNEYIKINTTSQSIEYRSGFSKKKTTFPLSSESKVYCQIDDISNQDHPDYLVSFYHLDENNNSKLFLQCQNQHNSYCTKFVKGFIRYITSISPIEKIEIIDKT
jgi:hypothetical protein